MDICFSEDLMTGSIKLPSCLPTTFTYARRGAWAVIPFAIPIGATLYANMPRCRSLLVVFLFAILSSASAVLGTSEVIRIMAANTSSGNLQSYDPGEGIRIFQGLDADIVLIQEFNFGNNSPSAIRAFVDQAFGSEFHFYREGGNEQIPNGVISRYPLISSGEWNDANVSNRDFAWARIDIPGSRDLWAISVHFLTTSSSNRNAQATALVQYVADHVPAGDYVLIGGDFNTDSFNESALNTLSAVVDVTGRSADQNGIRGTNASRQKPYDQVLPGPDLSPLEVPVAIAGHGVLYPEGLVFDSRVFTPLAAVSPVRFGDSGVSGMQHMAVVRDFAIPTDGEPAAEPSAYPSGFQGDATADSVTLTWTDVTASPVPDGYLVRASTGPDITPPGEGETLVADTDLSDGFAQQWVGAGVESVTFAGLASETVYYFAVYPHVGTEPFLFKVDEVPPAAAVTTLDPLHVRPEAPILGPVYYRHASGFTVTWESVAEASNYRLDLSESATFLAGDGGILIEENFDAGTAVPGGWVNSGTGISTNSAHYASQPNTRSLGQGHFIETPAVDRPGELRFYVDASNNGDGQTATVAYRIGNGHWLPLRSFTVSRSGNTETVALTAAPDLTEASGVAFRFESAFFTWYLDDVVVTAASGPGFVPGYEDRALGDGDYHAVDTLAPDTLYFYRLRSENEWGTSPDSLTGNVRTSPGGTPFLVWAAERGISGPTSTSDFDGDSGSDFEEFAFGTDPTTAEPLSDRMRAEKTPTGLRLTHLRSKAPNLTWRYFGAPSLDGPFQALVEGPGESQYQVVGRADRGAVVELTLEINTGDEEQYFLWIDVTTEPAP